LAAKRVAIAKIGGAHGTRGEVRLFAFADDPLAIGSYGALEDETGARRFRILSLRPGKNHLIARLEGVDDRSKAEQLANLELFVAREKLPALSDRNTFYQADLIGLRVETREGKALGTITGVQNFGAGDILEISLEGGGTSVMIPFLDTFVPLVDVAGGRMVVEPPAGLFEEPSPARGEGKMR
jgi:16S rRNA processing protein RimM